MPALLGRHPPDAGLAEAEIAAFDGFWQCQTLDTGLSCAQASDIRRAERRKCGFRCHPDAPLPWFLIGRKTIERFMSMRLPEAAAVINALRPKDLVSLVQWPVK